VSLSSSTIFSEVDAEALRALRGLRVISKEERCLEFLETVKEFGPKLDRLLAFCGENMTVGDVENSELVTLEEAESAYAKIDSLLADTVRKC
jgi:hypothetical protein